MKLWTLVAAMLLVAGMAAGQTNDTFPNDTVDDEQPVIGDGNDDGDRWSPVLVLALVIGLALLIGVIVAVVGRR